MPILLTALVLVVALSYLVEVAFTGQRRAEADDGAPSRGLQPDEYLFRYLPLLLLVLSIAVAGQHPLLGAGLISLGALLALAGHLCPALRGERC